MKLNWGHYIGISIGIFMAFILGLIFLLPGGEDKLRETDYYEQGLNHDAQMEKERNTMPYKEQVQVDYKAGVLRVDLPDNQMPGNIRVELIKPDKAELDFTVFARELEDSSAGSTNVMTHMRLMAKGFWKTRVSWEADSLGFYVEKDLYVQ